MMHKKYTQNLGSKESFSTESKATSISNSFGVKSPIFFICLSALLLVSGTYLQTIEIPVRITSDPHAADQYDLMHAFWPISLAMWILAFLLFVSSFFIRKRQFSIIKPQKRQQSKSIALVTVTLGITILCSLFLPWVIVDPSLPLAYSHCELTAFNIIENSYWSGDIIYLMYIAIVIAVIYVPLLEFFSHLNQKRVSIASAFLSITAVACLIIPILSVATTEFWWVNTSMMGGSGLVKTTFVGVGIGLLIAAITTCGVFVFGAYQITNFFRISKQVT